MVDKRVTILDYDNDIVLVSFKVIDMEKKLHEILICAIHR